jgi:hypothetical protein
MGGGRAPTDRGRSLQAGRKSSIFFYTIWNMFAMPERFVSKAHEERERDHD